MSVSQRILFRQIKTPLPPDWEPGAHWYVEYHAGPHTPFPIGMAFVTAFPQFAVVDFIYVVDQFRRNGVGTALVKACEERWPGIHVHDRVSHEGRAFLRSIGRSCCEPHGLRRFAC